MYKIYIRHFVPPRGWEGPNETIIETETLMYDYPVEYPEDGILIDPKVKNEMGKAGSFEFGMEQNCPWYSSLLQMTTLLRVQYDDETIFYGRVLAIDTDMWGKRQVHCEGALAFLLDTLIIATKEEEREKISLETYVKDLIDSHNNLVANEPNKQFHYGQIPGYYSQDIPAVMRPESEERKFGSGSWTSTMNCLEDLTSKYGGYWRARYEVEDFVDAIGQWGMGNIDLNNRIVVHNQDGSISTELSFSTNIDDKEVLLPTIINGVIYSEEDAIAYYETSGEYLGKFDTVEEAEDYAERLHERQEWYYSGQGKVGTLYLDWLLNMFDPVVVDQPLRLTENIIDISGTVDVNGIFTVLIPEGTKNGKPLYLDDVPKTIVKIPKPKKPKVPIGPGLGVWVDGQGMAFD